MSHQLPLDPAHLFDANIFYPEPRTLAFSEHMVVQGVMGMPLFALGWSAVTVYNVLVLAGFALSGLAMAIVVERWTGSRRAAIVAGLAYAFNAHTLVRFGHMQALHVQFLPLALDAIHDLLDRPDWGASLRLAVWCALQSLTSNYLLVMTALAMLVSAAAAPSSWIGSAGRRRVAMVLAAAAGCGAVLLPFLLPYYTNATESGMVRSFEEVVLFSGQWRDYLSTGGRLHYAAWSHRFFENSTSLFPGLTVLALAGVALADAATWRAHRTRAMVALAVVGVMLSFGATVPGYHWLFDHVPLLQGIRAVARLGWLALLALAVLAGAGLARLERRWPQRATALAIAAGILVTLEAARTPMTFTRFDGIPAIYRHVAALPEAVLVEFPFPEPVVIQDNGPYVFASTVHFLPMFNGYSGFTPASYYLYAAVAQRFPSAESLGEFSLLGATHIVVHGARLGAGVFEQLEGTGRVTLLAREGNDRLYALVPEAR